VRGIFALLLALACAACTPQQALLSALVPDGTASVLLGHLQGVEDANRRRIAELEQLGDWAGLVRFADSNIAIDPVSPEWRLIGGYAHARQRDFRSAAYYFGEMVRLAPHDLAGYEFLAEAQRAGGEPQRAVSTLERALRIGRESPNTYGILGSAYADLGRDAEAIAAYRRALEIDPLMVQALWGYGSASVRAGRLDEARGAARTLRQLDPPLAERLYALIAGK